MIGLLAAGLTILRLCVVVGLIYVLLTQNPCPLVTRATVELFRTYAVCMAVFVLCCCKVAVVGDSLTCWVDRC